MRRGKFITLYGINNIGKTTHAKRLVANFQKHGLQAVYVKYPVYDVKPSGPFLDRVLRSHSLQKISEAELQLWFILNRYQFEPRLRDMLSRGVYVVAEDYVGTGIAWGIAKGLKRAWLERMNEYLLKPDFSLFLTGKPEKSAQEKRHIHEQNDVLMKKTQSVLQILAKEYDWKTIRLCKKIEDTAEKIWMAVKHLFPA